MQFIWDERKNRSNKAKHRVSFETAMLVFEDPHHISRPDRVVDGELRWHTLGLVGGLQLLLVVHTVFELPGDGAETIRLISARKATPSERSIYAQDF